MTDQAGLIEVVLETRDEDGYTDVAEAINLLKARGVEWEPVDLWTVCSSIDKRHIRRLMRASERRFNCSQAVFFACAVFLVLSEIARWWWMVIR